MRMHLVHGIDCNYRNTDDLDSFGCRFLAEEIGSGAATAASKHVVVLLYSLNCTTYHYLD